MPRTTLGYDSAELERQGHRFEARRTRLTSCGALTDRTVGFGEDRAVQDARRARFIRENLILGPIPSLPGILLYTAHAASGLRRLGEFDGAAPYWAYQWGGGLALARHVLEKPQIVAGKQILDLGAGSGLVAIAAAKAGARSVAAVDTDLNALAAIGLNAEANGVALEILGGDITAGEPPPVDLVLIGDLFYEADLAVRVASFLDLCLASGITALVGDPGRAHLPVAKLRLLAEYAVADFGDARAGLSATSSVYEYTG